MIGPQHYLQHPEQIELELSPLINAPSASDSSLSLGLSLHCHHYYPIGKWLRIQAPALTDELSIDARVVDCNRDGPGQYRLQLSFPDQEQLFRARMLEQLCQICIYQHQTPEEERDRRALEWIDAEAAHFPSDDL
ncbi:MAG: hypothetical protein GYB41_05595 [Oceanospirillales bacterium]|uniref:PilZ domain-containing protein n=1 Tax=Marinobacterium halophilum TaxID=267374 RepID=A0A2P8F4T2_9GAMM|nr:hypothetical protein [Marinobacterium halophilum]MBR9828098.1 hypothetical protein [Oceanospirillales bacterium]PSL16711.1 hypothetical protein CLV44_101109 [Marinobacterium halophilum]